MGGVVALLHGRNLTAGVLLGLSLWAKWTNLVFFPVAVAALAARREWRALLRFGAAAAVPVMGLLGLNWHMFGSPFVTPYDRVLVISKVRWVVEPSHRTLFTVPFWRGSVDAADRLPDGPRPGGATGRFSRCPASSSCFGATARRRCWWAGRAPRSSPIFAKYEQWNVSSYGPRFLLSVVALSALPAAAAVTFVVKRVQAYLRPTDAVA